jgi:putative peptide zinc metalloprotease protein
MPTLADSLISSSARPLAIRMRPDLQVNQQRYQGRHYWIVKDPVGLNYFRFQEEEFAILNWLDGKTSLDELRTRFEKQFAPQKIALEELGRLIGMLHQSALVIAGVPGQGKQLLKRRWDRKKKEILGALANVLALRFKGIDPERIFNRIYPFVSWFFSKTAAFFCIMLLVSALSLVLVQFDEFRRRLPEFHQFFGPSNWIYLGAAMAVTKVLHEFGHGLSCKHFGGECHELGVMMLVLTPCLYCNVSDSWMLPNKWHRAFIGAAGMYVEVCIASIATFVWWFSAPGLLNHVALSTMFVCSVSTLVFNGNPLLRYDGYYILSDILEIPNLRQKATTILNRKMGAWFLGLEEPDDPFLPKRNQALFALYSVAAATYSWVVMCSILFFLFKVFEPYRLEVIGQMIAAASIASLVGRPLWSMGKFFYVPGRVDDVKKPRLYATLGVLGVILLAFLFLPLPYHVFCALEVQPHDSDQVIVKVDGQLDEIEVKPSDPVKKGKVLAVLHNDDLELQIASKETQLKAKRAELESLRFSTSDPKIREGIAPLEDDIVGIEAQLKEKYGDLDKLCLKAEKDGVVIPPPMHPKSPNDTRLPTWSGTPLEQQNVGATLKQGTVFCRVADPDKYEAVLYVDQSDIDQLHIDEKVKIMLDQLPGVVFHTTVTEKSTDPVKYTPKALSNKSGGTVETKSDESGASRPASVLYQATAPLNQTVLVTGIQGKSNDAEDLLAAGLKGQAKIDAPWHSLGWRTWRFLQRTFHFKL